MASHRESWHAALRRRIKFRSPYAVGGVVLGSLAGILVGGAVYASGTSQTISCTQTSSKLTCPLVVPTVTTTVVAAGPTVTVTASPSASSSSAGPTSSPTPTDSPTSTSPVPPPNSFPNDNTTGVPDGTALKTVPDGYTVPAGGTANALNVQGDLIVGTGATVTNTRVTGRIRSTASLGQLSNVKISDTDVGPDSCPTSQNDNSVALLTGTFSLLRVHAHNWDQDLLRLVRGTGSVTDSLIDQTCYYPGDHLDAVQFFDKGGAGHWTFEHDAIWANPVNTKGFEYGNSGIFWSDHPADASTLTVAGTYFNGGNYALVTYDAGTIAIRDNTFEAFTVQYGYCVSRYVDPTYSGNTLTTGDPAAGCG